MALKHSPLTELMHAVLDGEASAGDARRLELQLAADPAARAEFEEWKLLFSALAEVPKEHVPEGLVASVSAAAPAARRDAHQPFSIRRVLGDTSATPSRSVKMTQESSRRIFAHRKAWLGAGVAAAAAVVVAQVAFDFPIAKDVTGTVIPAQRYRAEQNGSEQVQVGTPAAQVAPTGAAPEAGRSFAEKAAGERSESALSADRMQTGLTAGRTQLELKADRTQAEMMADRKQGEMTADRTMNQLKADRAQSDLKADRSQAEMMAGRTQVDLKADRAAADLKADRAAADLKADRAAADMTMQRSSADKTMQLNSANKMSIDRSAQQ